MIVILNKLSGMILLEAVRKEILLQYLFLPRYSHQYARQIRMFDGVY